MIIIEEPKIKPQLKLVATYFVGKCCGNAEKSVVEAGYSKKYARGNAHKIVARRDVQAYIEYLRSKEGAVQREIMELDELKEFWTRIIKDTRLKTSDRLRASELLGKSQGAFIEQW